VRTFVGAFVVALASAVTVAPMPEAVASTPLEEAREAARSASFSGVVDVVWREGSVRRHRALPVRASGGALLFEGPKPLLALDEARLARGDRAWDVLWPAALGRVRRPDTSDKYDLRVAVGPQLLGHSTARIDVRRGDALRDRLYVDLHSGLLLKREQFDAGGVLQRSMAFTSLRPNGRALPVPRAGQAPEGGPEPVGADGLGATYTAPANLPEGYQRTGVFRRGRGVVQVAYSDGIYDLSVFEQRGRLSRGGVPDGGRRTRIGRSHGWHYSWPGGQVLVWPAGRTVYTLVGDAPLEDLLGAASGLPEHRSTSLVHRLRQGMRTLVGAFATD
jgi:hypothetical protein